jgi:hypothetical protein
MSKKYVAKQRSQQARQPAAPAAPAQDLLGDNADATPPPVATPVAAQRLGLSLVGTQYLETSHPELLRGLLNAQACEKPLDFEALPEATREFLRGRVFIHRPLMLGVFQDPEFQAQRAAIEKRFGKTRLAFEVEDMLSALRAAAEARAQKQPQKAA